MQFQSESFTDHRGSQNKLRSLVNSNFNRSVVVSLQENEGLEEHSSVCPMLLDVLEGQLSLEIGGLTTFLEPGNCFYVPDGAVHSLIALEDSRFRITIYRTGRIVRTIGLAS